jgi:D-citramalate synthase
LGKTSGKANIRKNLEELGITLDAEALRKVTERIIELGDQKETVTIEDLPYIISDVLKSEAIEQTITLKNYSTSHALGLRPVTGLSIEIDGQVYEEHASGDGQYDAFMNALKGIYKKLGRPLPRLVDYMVTIPPGGRTDALVETVITWELDKEFKTRGLDPDQTVAAIKATMKMLNILENEFKMKQTHV